MTAGDWALFAQSLAAAGVARGTPLLYATVGEILAERSGVLNLGLEGLMLAGAMTGFGVAHATGSAWLGLLAALAVGGALSLLHAVAAVFLRADQVVSSLALAFFGAGLASVLGAPLVGIGQVARLPAFPVPLLSRIPVLGPVLFDHNVVVYLSYLLVPAVWFYVHRTRPGLHLRAAGENPAAADALGVRVRLIRVGHVVAGGALAGAAGATLSLAITPGWIDEMTAGQGWIALALVIFAGWSPLRAMAGAYLFGAIRRLPLDLQGVPGVVQDNPNLGYFLDMLPYLVTIGVLVLASRESVRRRVGAPAALGRPFGREDR